MGKWFSDKVLYGRFHWIYEPW